jgi:hypothetical protein
MSYYSYLINKENKTYYCLGKGCFADFCYEIADGILDEPEFLAEFIFNDVFNGYDQDDIGELREHCINTANEICEFAKGSSKDKFFVFTDCGDDLWAIRCLDYQCVGSRYGEDDVLIEKEYCEKYKNKYYNIENLITSTSSFAVELYERYK